MAPSLYAPLHPDTFSIRLIKLQPSDDPSAPIRCKLVTYPIDSERLGAHSYECLSYVWGTENYKRLIEIDTEEAVVPFQATPNLYEALLHLRDPFFEQILWIDSICINQEDNNEKATQVAAMAIIYGLAKRVVVWLGAEADESALAFQRLMILAQTHQSADQSRSGEKRDSLQYGVDVLDLDHAESEVDREMVDPNADQPIQTLLNRPYFRRMWILQEVTAARNMLFKCGEAELQTSTFLAGIDALGRLDDLKLRHRILAFLLLIRTSAFREGLKGQAHLSIEPLADLIDRFRAHDATDSRDKIYALWGLCSDSSQMQDLRPDYKKKWKDLFEDLGKLVFGKTSIVSASPIRQMVFVRTIGYILGEVESIPGTVAGRLWENTQAMEVTSLRASTWLSHTRDWSVWIKMRASAEQILEGDYVLYLPSTSGIVFARPTEYYLQVVMVIASSKVEHKRPEKDYWESWQTWLGNADEVVSSLPLLWSWEKQYEQEKEHCFELMTNCVADLASATDPIHAQALCRAQALSEMAALYTEYKKYDLASNLLANMVEIYGGVCVKEYESAGTGLRRMNDALDKNAKYLKTKGLLLDSQGAAPSRHFILDCATMILGENNLLDRPVSDHVLVDFVSKEMTKGVSRELLVQALEQCANFADSPSNSIVDGYRDEQKPDWTIEMHDNYLDFLLALAEDGVFITEAELLVAARKKISGFNFIRLAKRSERPLRNICKILEALRSTQWPGTIVHDLITELGDATVVAPDGINVAVKWDVGALSALLKAANGAPVVTPAAFAVAMQTLTASTPAIIELLVQHAGIGCVISEETIRLIAWTDTSNKAPLYKTQLQWIFISLLENIHLVINVPEDVFGTTTTPEDMICNNITELLRFRPDIKFSDEIRELVPISQVDIDALSANDIADYASFINLIRYRRTEFEITEKLLSRVVSEQKKKAKDSSWLYGEDTSPWESLLVIDRCTAFLITHADNDIVGSLISSSAFVDTAASRGFLHAIDAIRGRSHNTVLHLDTLHVVAEICLLLQRPLQPGESFAQMPIIVSLVQTLARMAHKSVSDTVKREMFLHARGGQYRYQVIGMLLDDGILDANVVDTWEEQCRDTNVVNAREQRSPDTKAGHEEDGVYNIDQSRQ